MATMLIKIQPEATGWHENIRCEAPWLTDGWAVVPAALEATVCSGGGVVDFQLQYGSAEEYPEVVDRRTEERGQLYPVAADMTLGTYLAPEPPAPPTEEELAEMARSRRDQLLAQTDWTQLMDAPVDRASQEALRQYRQALRDVPQQEAFPGQVVWPEQPDAGKAEPDPVDTAFDTLVGGEDHA